MFPKAEVVQIDIEPLGLRDGMQAADIYLRADAKAARRSAQPGAAPARCRRTSAYRSPESRERIARSPPISAAEFAIAPGTFDPRAVIAELDRVIPKDCDLVTGSGHQGYFQTHMRGRKPENYHVMREFGAITWKFSGLRPRIWVWK